MDISDHQKEDSMIEIQRLKNKAFKPFVYYCNTHWQTVDKDPDEYGFSSTSTLFATCKTQIIGMRPLNI